jgi:limonene-1,2-epoxide hydrolase
MTPGGARSPGKGKQMRFVTATATVSEKGPLTQIVEQYSSAIASQATGDRVPDWEPLREFVAVDEFRRVGAYLEEMSWDEYTRFMTEWAGSTRFEMTVFQITEVGDLVVQEIEERHYRGDNFVRKNVVAIYRFNTENKISHLDIYEQAGDSGQWIIDAARSSTKGAP